MPPLAKAALERVYLKGHPAWGLGPSRWTGHHWGPRCSKSLLDTGTAIAFSRKGQVGRDNCKDLESVKASWVQVRVSL